MFIFYDHIKKHGVLSSDMLIRSFALDASKHTECSVYPVE